MLEMPDFEVVHEADDYLVVRYTAHISVKTLDLKWSKWAEFHFSLYPKFEQPEPPALAVSMDDMLHPKSDINFDQLFKMKETEIV